MTLTLLCVGFSKPLCSPTCLYLRAIHWCTLMSVYLIDEMRWQGIYSILWKPTIRGSVFGMFPTKRWAMWSIHFGRNWPAWFWDPKNFAARGLPSKSQVVIHESQRIKGVACRSWYLKKKQRWWWRFPSSPTWIFSQQLRFWITEFEDEIPTPLVPFIGIHGIMDQKMCGLNNKNLSTSLHGLNLGPSFVSPVCGWWDRHWCMPGRSRKMDAVPKKWVTHFWENTGMDMLDFSTLGVTWEEGLGPTWHGPQSFSSTHIH